MATKKRGLAGTPEEHQARVGPAARSAKSAIKAAVVLADRGKCRAALESLISGHQDLAIAIDNSYGRVNDDLDSFLEERSKYQKAFANKCLVGAGLSGLRRRKARR